MKQSIRKLHQHAVKHKEKILQCFISFIVLLIAIAYVAKISGPKILRFYIENGFGDCRKIPIFCIAPEIKVSHPAVNKEYLSDLILYKFSPDIEIYLPKEFRVVKESITKVYYKKRRPHGDATVYLLHEEPNFFLNLFPHLKKKGILDDYEFIRRTMFARVEEIKNLTDAFFVIMKGIFIPDLGDQTQAKMAQFSMADKKGFVNYNVIGPQHYFDCNVINNQGDFFKIYIKDKGAILDLGKIFTILSTVRKAE